MDSSINEPGGGGVTRCKMLLFMKSHPKYEKIAPLAYSSVDKNCASSGETITFSAFNPRSRTSGKCACGRPAWSIRNFCAMRWTSSWPRLASVERMKSGDAPCENHEEPNS